MRKTGDCLRRQAEHNVDHRQRGAGQLAGTRLQQAEPAAERGGSVGHEDVHLRWHGQPHLRGDGCHNRHAELPGHLQPHLERADRCHDLAHVHPRRRGQPRPSPGQASRPTRARAAPSPTAALRLARLRHDARGRLATVSQDGNPGLRRGRPQGHVPVQQHAPRSSERLQARA